MGHLPESYGGRTESTTEVVRLPVREKDTGLGATSLLTGQAEATMIDVTHAEAVGKGGESGERKAGGVVVEVECPSLSTSPSESGSTTPTLRIAACPPRLSSLVPPPNYGAAMEGNLFRSAYPQDRNMDFMKLLDVRSVLCLVETEPSESYAAFISKHNIARHRVDIAANKDGKVKTTWDSLCQALLIVMDSANYPLYVHCNQGKHRTGCVIACLRKIQRWDLEDVVAEYQAYAHPKVRPGDIELIRAFDPDAVFEYAKRHCHMDAHRILRRSDSLIANIDALADALAGKLPYCDDIDMSTASNASTISDDGFGGLDIMEMDPPVSHGDIATVATTQRPGLERMASRPQAAGSALAAAEPAVLDPALHEAGPVTSIVELADDALSPPLEPSRSMGF
ncbi:tyrosine-protein phosphatase siw14 [Teratosphaeriaceae sp. CCFEE 6253]|nr:tyrosine-protein phosphatase siw14 [Teratosphaeriaceae sp. CCFEE 6253]